MPMNSGITKEAPPIGIDLGTKCSCVGVFRNGKVEIIANEQGNFTTPSYVAFTENERLIGDAAKQQMASNATNTIFDVKRLIGRNFDDQIVQDYMEQGPFKVISVDGIPKFEIMFKNVVKHLSAVEVSAMILGKMKKIAESYLGATVTKAVITCPAYFNDFQRQATIDAGKIAGMNILAIVDEPTAASIGYGIGVGSKTGKKILVYDLSGSTVDVSIVDVRGNQVTVEATGGDTHLGEEDGVDFQVEISRTHFESLCSDLLDKSVKMVKSLLQDANLSYKDIDEIILVGGSIKIVMIQQLLQDLFKGKNIIKRRNPDQVVACGAAVLAWNCSIEVDDLQLSYVTPLSLGIAIKHPDACRDEVMWKLIRRNTPVPVVRTEIFPIIDNQTVSISVLQGEHHLARDNVQIGNLTFNGIPTNSTGMETVTVKFSIDENGILTATAFSNTNGKAKGEITVHNVCERISRSEISRMIVERGMYRQLDEELTTVYTAEGGFEGYCYKTNS